MAQENLNTSTPNSGLGDFLRAAFVKVQNMFTELYSNKIDKEVGKGLSANDFTGVLKNKLDNIAGFAEVNVQADFNQADNTQDNFIKNKPVIPVLGDYVLNGGFVGTAVDLAPKASPTFTGTVSGITKAMVGLSNVDNTSDANKGISDLQLVRLNLKANLASPTFTGTVSGITQTMVGLGNVDNTQDGNKPVSTAQAIQLNLKANLASPIFTGTVSGITKAMVGLGNVQNTDLTSTVDLKINLTEKGAVNGVVPLDSGAKILSTYFPDSILGNLKFGGTYNGSVIAASASFSELQGLNLPTTGYLGIYFITTTAFTRASVTYDVGDWVLHNGSDNYVKVDNTDAVSTVFGRIGNVLANSGDYAAFYSALGHVHAIADVTGLQSDLNAKLNLTGGTLIGAVTFSGDIITTHNTGFRSNFATDSTILSSYNLAGVRKWQIDTINNGFSLFMQGANAYVFNILNGGNVGIGTTTPTVRLDVVGNGKFSGTGTFGGDILLTGIGRGISFNGLETQIYESAGSLRIYTNTLDRLVVLQNGNVGIGTNNPTERLDVVGNGKFSGTVTASGGFFNSDMRLKDLITPYDYKQLANLNPITFKWKDGRDDLNHYGYSAQEVEKYMPHAINKDYKGFMSVNYTEVLVAKVALLENEVKELKRRLN